jgi:hypothetical protein
MKGISVNSNVVYKNKNVFIFTAEIIHVIIQFTPK